MRPPLFGNPAVEKLSVPNECLWATIAAYYEANAPIRALAGNIKE